MQLSDVSEPLKEALLAEAELFLLLSCQSTKLLQELGRRDTSLFCACFSSSLLSPSLQLFSRQQHGSAFIDKNVLDVENSHLLLPHFAAAGQNLQWPTGLISITGA